MEFNENAQENEALTENGVSSKDEILIKDNPSPVKVKPLKIILWILGGLIFILSIILVVYFQSDTTVVNSSIKRQDAIALYKYVYDNQFKYEDKKENMDKAITGILNSRNSNAISSLETLFWVTYYRDPLKLEIIKAFNDNNVVFTENPDNLIDSFLKRAGAYTDFKMEDEFKEMFKNYGSTRLAEVLLLKVKTEYESNNYTQAADYADILSEYFGNVSLQFSSLSEPLRSLNEIIPEIDIQKAELDSLNKSIETMYDNYSPNSILTIEAYVVGQIEKNKYEISLPYSLNHAYLLTVDTTFQSKGWFAMNVVSLGKTSVQLKEEYGGFTQDWDIYLEMNTTREEYEKEYYEKYINLASQINNVSAEISSLNENAAKNKNLILFIFLEYIDPGNKETNIESLKIIDDESYQVFIIDDENFKVSSITLSMTKTEIVEILGEPEKVDTVKVRGSENGDSTEEILNYKDMTIIIRDDICEQINISDTTYTTKKGIRIGDDLNTVFELYGDCQLIIGNKERDHVLFGYNDKFLYFLVDHIDGSSTGDEKVIEFGIMRDSTNRSN